MIRVCTRNNVFDPFKSLNVLLYALQSQICDNACASFISGGRMNLSQCMNVMQISLARRSEMNIHCPFNVQCDVEDFHATSEWET
jgi:hypothetical protein